MDTGHLGCCWINDGGADADLLKFIIYRPPDSAKSDDYCIRFSISGGKALIEGGMHIPFCPMNKEDHRFVDDLGVVGVHDEFVSFPV